MAASLEHRNRMLAHLEKQNMGNNVIPVSRNTGGDEASGALMESVVIKGDLSKLTPEDRASYYMTVCKSVGLNPLTKPFEYITLNGKLTLYALRTCTDQLRTIHNVSVLDVTEAERDGVLIVTCKVANGDGRTDISKGAVTIKGLAGEALSNAIMKAETKAKRRATLSICGLGFLDETEIETIPAAAKTLPKKDARSIYEKLQREIDESPSYEDLKQWGVDAKPRIEVLPNDWQEHLRLRYHERLVDQRQHQRRAKPAPTDIAPGETPNPETGEVVWGEPPEADDGGIPAEFRRAARPTTTDEKEWLNDLAGAFSTCEDMVSFGEKQRDVMAPKKGFVTSEAWTAAQHLAEDAFKRIQASS